MKTSPHPQTRFDMEEATISGVRAALRDHTLTVRQLVQGYLDRIAAYDRHGPCINSIIRLNPQALAEADRIDAALAGAQQKKMKSLLGVPVLVKDNIETKGLATSAGSPVLKDYVPLDDAFIVKRLRDAGAIVLAKTNLHELACGGETVNALIGQTLNPYDLSRTPGGSSGGTGAGIAANFGLLGIGSDGINSIRSPASANNLVGLRPTMGLVSRTGLIPCGLTQDTIGPITRTVTDAAILLDVIAGPDGEDPATREVGPHIPSTYTAFLDRDGMKGARIGVLKHFFGDKPEHQQVNAVIRKALAILERQGATLVAIDDPINPDDLLATTLVHHYEMQQHLDAYLARLPSNIKVRSLEDIVVSGLVHTSVAGTLRTAMELAHQKDEYRDRLQRQEVLRHRMLDLMASHRIDALAFPHQRRLVVPIGETQSERNGVLASATGFPSITIPAGFSVPDPNAPLGIPVGMEFFGKPFSEAVLIRLAYAAEQAIQARKAPHATPALV